MPATDTYLCLVCLQQLHLSEVVTHWQTVHQDEHAATASPVTAQTDPVDGSEDRTQTHRPSST